MKKNDLIISGHHMELTDALKAFVTERAEKLFRHEPRIIRLRVELDADATKHHEKLLTAKGIISIEGPDLVAAETSQDMYYSIDQMTHKLDRMLRNRSRLQLKKRDHPHGIDLPAALPKVD